MALAVPQSRGTFDACQPGRLLESARCIALLDADFPRESIWRAKHWVQVAGRTYRPESGRFGPVDGRAQHLCRPVFTPCREVLHIVARWLCRRAKS